MPNKTRNRGFVALPQVMPMRVKGRKRAGKKSPARKRNAKGLLGDIGNMLLPGIGGIVGGIGDNLLGGLLGGRSNNVGIASAGRTRARQVNRSVEYGSEQITTIQIPANTPAGTVLLQSLIAAPTIGVRLKSFASLWTKTKFRKFRARVTSSNPSTVAGNYTLAIDPDPVQSYISGPGIPARLMALTSAMKANAWADAEVEMMPNPISLFNKFNFATASDAELREFACGQLIMATTTTYPEDCEYTVNIDWDVEFERPDTNQDNSEPGGGHTVPLRINAFYANVDGATDQNLIMTGDQAANMFNVNPPDGTYLTPGLAFDVQWLEAGVQKRRNFIVSGFTLSTLSNSVIWRYSGSDPLSTISESISIISNNPSDYTVPGVSVPIDTRGIGLRKVGLAQVHGLIPEKPHLEWAEKSNREKFVRDHHDIIRSVQAERLRRRLLEVDDDAVLERMLKDCVVSDQVCRSTTP